MGLRVGAVRWSSGFLLHVEDAQCSHRGRGAPQGGLGLWVSVC